MAAIYRALLWAVLVLYAGVAVSGARAAGGEAALRLHLSAGLVAAILASLALSLPFAYFLGTGFWVKGFVRASRADASWEARHALWMKGRAYPWMYAAPFAAVATAVTGALVETGRLPAVGHTTAVLAAALCALVSLRLVPAEMRRNSALMDELAERHRVPAPGSSEHAALVAHEESAALPPLFQLSRVLLYAAAQVLVVWLYLRFGTDGWRDTPLLPWALAALALLTTGLGLNARHDPERPRSAAVAWARALAVGLAGTILVLALPGAFS